MPWQESIACMGYYAGWRVTGDIRYKDLALALARTITRWAFFKDSTGWHVCTGVPWNDGNPLDPGFYYMGNPGLPIGDGLHSWTVPACVILLAPDPTDGPDSVRAQEILQQVYGGGFSKWAHSAWLAVR